MSWSSSANLNLSTKERILELADERRHGISAQKGPEYTGAADSYADDDRDVLANFKRQGERWGSSPILPMGIYFGKHIDSIETFVREVTREGVTLAQQKALAYKGEGILSRLDDARNYLDLMECLLVEQGILNDPRPEAYSRQPQTPNTLEALGEVQYGDVLKADADELKRFVDDYNYMRSRVSELRKQKDDYYQMYAGARAAANRLAEEALDADVVTEALEEAQEAE